MFSITVYIRDSNTYILYIYKEKGYARPYLTDPRKLYQIGVNFSSETGTMQGLV